MVLLLRVVVRGGPSSGPRTGSPGHDSRDRKVSGRLFRPGRQRRFIGDAAVPAHNGAQRRTTAHDGAATAVGGRAVGDQRKVGAQPSLPAMLTIQPTPNLSTSIPN